MFCNNFYHSANVLSIFYLYKLFTFKPKATSPFIREVFVRKLVTYLHSTVETSHEGHRQDEVHHRSGSVAARVRCQDNTDGRTGCS